MARLRVALAQLNLVVGDLDGNADHLIAAVKAAEADGCDLVAFPELSITGYPPEDLLLKPGFVADNVEVLARVAAATGRCAALVGFVERDGDRLYNAAAVCADGRVVGTYRKRELPNYEVFDERFRNCVNRTSHVERLGYHGERFVEAGGTQIVHFDAPHHEHQGETFEKFRMWDTRVAQRLGTRAFRKA